jgi:thioredoxin 1
MKQLTDAEFPGVTCKGVVLVDFWAEWCSACKALTPILEKLSEDFAGKAEFYKVNCDDNQEVAASIGVRGLPTIAVYKDGQLVETIVGKRDKGVYEASLRKLL